MIAVTSSITMTELLVQPYRDGNVELANLFLGLLSSYPNLTWVAPNLDVCEHCGATSRRASTERLRMPYMAATAVAAHATGFITNDSVFERVPELETVVLDRLIL